VASWDSSIHDSAHLNKITEPTERVYMILRITVRLSHPAPMNLVLRKRLALNIYKRQSITDRIKRKIVRSDVITQCGVTYEVVSNVPKACEELEDRESLAQLVASGEESSFCDGETYIEKYTRGVSAVESILTLDRLRQSVAVKELLQARGQPLMRKTASVPNFSQFMRLDTSTESLQMSRSESVSELNSELHGVATPLRPRTSFGKDSEGTPTKPFGIVFPGITSPANTKLGLRMTTLHEEQPTLPRKHSLDILSDNTIEEQCEDGQDEKQTVTRNVKSRSNGRRTIPTSRTLDSLVELAPKSGTPSATSSGYGSQAVSSTNLSSDDSMSLRSISVDETPDLEGTPAVSNDLQPVTEVVDSSSENYPESNSGEDQIADGGSEDYVPNGVDNHSDNNQEKPACDNEESTVIKTNLSPGRVVRRKKTSKTQHSQRASFPQARPQLSESKVAHSLEQSLISTNLIHDDEGLDSSTDRLEDDSENNFGSKPDLTKLSDVPVPEWVVLGESVLIRPYNSSGVVAYIGGTEFASGTWIGVELDAPKGKNDGSIQGVRYFSCRPKYGMFVRADKLILDRRGRAMRAYKADSLANNKCASGKGDGLPRSRSRGDGLNSVGTRPSSKAK
jgi:kinesin family protein 13